MMSEQVSIKYKIHGIEQSDLTIFKRPDDFSNKVFVFSVSITDKYNPEQGIILCIVDVSFSTETEEPLANVKLLIGFEIENFHTVILKNNEGQFVMPNDFKTEIYQECISTSRGYIFFLFKGTYLHKAILPLLRVNIES